MLCYSCDIANKCNTFRTLYSISDDFCINSCKGYEAASVYKYRKIAENDDLMKLIYDYFTDQVKGYTLEEAKEAITRVMWNL